MATEREKYLQYLKEQRELLDPNVSRFEGNAWDFAGQALWGFMDQATMGTLGVSDAINEAYKGDAANTWEEMFAGDAAGSYEELPDTGKAGYAVGAALGQIPSFWLGGMFTNAAVKGVGKIGAGGAKMAIKKSSKELAEQAAKMQTSKSGISAAKSITDDVAKTIVEDAYKYSAGANSIRQLEGNIASDLYEKTMVDGIKTNIASTLKIADDEILEGLAKSTFDIVTKNNPDDAFSLLQMLVAKAPGIRNTEWGPRLLGAMGYDAAIGFTLGTMRTGVQEIQRSQWGVEPNEYGEMVRSKEAYKFDAGRLGKNWLTNAVYDAALFAPMGVAQFVKGGTSANHLKRLTNMIHTSTKAYWKPLAKYTNTELRAQLTAMDEITGGYLNIGRGTKFEKMGARWWVDATTDADSKLMREYLGKIRREYVTKAPIEWTKEFGKDAIGSLPRMATGVVAMHAPHVIMAFTKQGLSAETFQNAMGGSMPEIAANIFTAMYFTKRPHSFHVEATPGMLSKMFETGQIKDYYGAKQSKLRKMLGGLNTFGIERDQMMRIVSSYSRKTLEDYQAEGGESVIKRAIDKSPELNEIKSILSRYENKAEVGGADLKISFAKKIQNMIENKELTVDDSLLLYDNLLVAEKILETYNNNNPNTIDLNNISPDTAYELVTKLSNIDFNGEKLNKYNYREQLKSWTENTVRDAVRQPQEILKQYIVDIYKSLGMEDIDINEFGVIKAPRLSNIVFGNKELEHIFATIYENGIKNNWIDPQTPRDRTLTTIDGELQGKAKFVHDNASERMMNLVYGENWKNKSIEYDPLILTNEAWHTSFDTYLKMEQQRNAYEILTEGKKHNATVQESTDLLNAIDNLMLSRQKPIINKDESVTDVDFGELSSFIDNLHEITISLNPDIKTKVPKTLSQQEATGLMEKVNSMMGDIMTNPASFKDFKQYIFNKSIDRLGLNDMTTGIDAKASVLSLRNNVDFNYQETGTNMIFPSRNRIVKNLLTALQSNKISRDAYNELLSHYDSLIGNIGESRFPIQFDDLVVEPKDAAWIKALTKSLVDGKDKMDVFANDKARQTSELLANEADKLTMLYNQIGVGVDSIDPVQRDFARKQMEEIASNRDATINLTSLIKTALLERNKPLLDAVARKEGDIVNAIEILSKDPLNSDRAKYLTEILKLEQDIRTDAQKQIINDESLTELIRNELSQYAKDIPEKDLQDSSLRMTSSQFQVKYNISHKYIDNLFEIDRSTVMTAKDLQSNAQKLFGEYWELSRNIDNPDLRSQVETAIRTLKAASGDVQLSDANFNNFIVKPLKLAMQIEIDKMPFNNRFSSDVIDADLYSITSSYFSKVPIKTLKVNLNNNSLIQNTKVVGDVQSRGIMGILNYLDSSQNNIYLAENAGIDINGKTIRDINGFDLDQINGALNSGNMDIKNLKGESDFYKHGDPTTLKDRDMRGADIKARYRIIPMNEKTSLIVRMDRGNSSVHQQIRAQFSNDGELYKKLLATMDGDLTTDSKRTVLDLLHNVRAAKTDVDVVQAIKLTRLLLDMPHAIEKVVDNGQINLDHPFIKDTFKRAGLVETKNGFVPTNKNIGRFASMYKNADSDLYKGIHRTLSRDGWLTPDADGNYKKLKTLSIDDEAGNLVDSNGDPVSNIFDSLARARVDLDQKLNNKEIDPDTYKQNIDLIGDATKSIVDGEMFLSKNAYLMAMSMIGTHPEMVRTDINGKVIGFKSGGIKPTITHSDINFDKSSRDYGRVQTWFGKTAFKYNPILDKMMKNLGVDALTFKSGNKINTLKPRKNAEYDDMYAKIIGSNEPMDLAMNWDKYLAKGNIEDPGSKIIELPWESMSLRTVSKEHDPLVGANTGVHMSHDNGIADWIGIDSKIASYNKALSNMYTNPFYKTALAQRVLGAQAETGDPSMVNSAVASILKRDGIILEPWAQQRLENSMIGYFMNNGGIAGGIVPNGSLDVMTADMGNLDISVRSSINGRNTVQYFGEFLPSYYAAQKQFIKPGEDLSGANNILIQKIKYKAENNTDREADAFITTIGDKKFLQVEGRAIDEKGRILELDGFTVVGQENRVNEGAFQRASKLDAEGLDMIDYGTTLAEAALQLQNKKLSIGMLNSRQPRNMIGDIVISKMAIVDGKAHVDEIAGNVSRMNHMDAIKPQDADFDMDKSFNFVAAPSLFWREANKLAGHITTESVDGVLNKLFDPNVNTGRFAKSLPDLLGADATNDQILHEVNKARGQFIKMHQTATYLSNIFRQNPTVLQFSANFVEGYNKALTVRLNQNGNYISTVDNISRMAKEYIDVYKNLPSKQSAEQIRDIQNKIFFGENGIFDVMIESKDAPGNYKKVDINLTDPQYRRIQESIRKRIINPLNKYLKYNRGVHEDPGSGVQQKAVIKNYNDSFVELYNTMDTNNLIDIPDGVDINAGLVSMADYFKFSRNPYDVAMKGLHETYQKTTAMKEEGAFGRGMNEAMEIKQYIDNGYIERPNMSQLEIENKLFNTALKEYVKDESRIIRLNDLARQETNLKLEIEKKRAFVKNDLDDNLEITRLNEKLGRVQNLKTEMEEALSYMFKDNFIEQPETVKYNPGYKSGRLTPFDKPYVILNKAGNIKEVINVGNYNRNDIYPSDKIVVNGRRFQVTDGETQKGLRILSEAFSGLPVLTDEAGNFRKITKNEFEYINNDYKSIVAQIMQLQDIPRVGREGIANFSLQRERILYDRLFNEPKVAADEVYRKALIMQMINPYISDKVVSVRALNDNSGKRAVYDYMYTENALSEPVISLLAKIQSGEHKGDQKFAKEVLDDINKLKTVALLKTENPNIDFNLVKARMFTEPASIDGFMTKDKYLNQDIYDKTKASDEIVRTAAEVMVNYANGEGLVDPVLLYKASVTMAKNGIDYGVQWSNKRVIADSDGIARDFGIKERLITEIDAINRKDLGEKGGQGESSSERIKNLFDCYKIRN